MLILVLFSTTEGHTRKLTQFAAARLRGSGYEVRLHDAARPDLPDPAEFDATLLLASVHIGRYQRPFVGFARKNHNALNAVSRFPCPRQEIIRLISQQSAHALTAWSMTHSGIRMPCIMPLAPFSSAPTASS
jgi:hypothetical protein